ncbi:energy transducer TonB [Novosphingobium sp. ZN18A2]|uniref:energy transducer TonB n=1 Tax=Novosphingobium sp. ZN18A2 TaxID=3079861 RepID=UPI0030D107A7
MRYALLAAGAAILIAPGAVAAQSGSPIEIEGNRANVQNWATDVSHALDRKLTYPMYYGFQGAREGYAQISFRVGADGAPAAVMLTRSTGSSRLDRAALAAVEGIRNMAPLPAGVSPTVRATVVFGLDQSTRTRLAREAGASLQSDQVALTVMPAAAA